MSVEKIMKIDGIYTKVMEVINWVTSLSIVCFCLVAPLCEAGANIVEQAVTVRQEGKMRSCNFCLCMPTSKHRCLL